jgi:hypothetical protein
MRCHGDFDRPRITHTSSVRPSTNPLIFKQIWAAASPEIFVLEFRSFFFFVYLPLAHHTRNNTSL